jgi:methylamine dehydrogenase accessory protein MauD
LWVIVVALGLLALSHSRLLGLMYLRMGPGVARPLPEGPAVGSSIPEITATTVHGQTWTRQFPVAGESLLIFISPQCQACNELMPHVRDFVERLGAKAEIHLLSVLGDVPMNRAYVEFARLENVPYLIADTFARHIDIASTPFGFKLDRNGRVLAKGVVNHFEHLASLWNVTETDRRISIEESENAKREGVIA